MKPTIDVSPITNTIYAGRLNKNKTKWVGEKHDITDECVMAVVQYIKKDRVIYERDGERYEMKEFKLDEK